MDLGAPKPLMAPRTSDNKLSAVIQNYRPFQKKREYVRDIRMAAYRAATVPPRPSRQPPKSPVRVDNSLESVGLSDTTVSGETIHSQTDSSKPSFESSYDLRLQDLSFSSGRGTGLSRSDLKAELQATSSSMLHNYPTQLDHFSSHENPKSLGTQLDMFVEGDRTSTSMNHVNSASNQAENYYSNHQEVANFKSQLDSFNEKASGETSNRMDMETRETYHHTIIVKKQDGIVHHHHHHHHHHYYGESDAKPLPLNSTNVGNKLSSDQSDREDMMSCVSRNTRRSRTASTVLETLEKEPDHIHTLGIGEEEDAANFDEDSDSLDAEEKQESRYVGLSIEGNEDQDAGVKERGTVLPDDEQHSESRLQQSGEEKAPATISRTQLLLSKLDVADACQHFLHSENGKTSDPASLWNLLKKVSVTSDISLNRDTTKKEGYMLMLPSDSNSDKWHLRFFTLSDRSLTYMHEKELGAPKFMVDLNDLEVSCEQKEASQLSKKYAFRVTTLSSRKSIWLCCDDVAEAVDWYRAILINSVNLASGACNVATSTNSPSNKDRSNSLRRTMFYPLFRKPPTFYDILDVSPSASASQIKKAFRLLAREFHPDKNPDADPSEFASISHAYDVLVNADLRSKYDLGEKVKDALRRGFDAIIYIPTEMEYDDETKKSYPSQLEKKEVTFFCDGNIKRIFYQASSFANDPLHPDLKKSFELRMVQRVIYGRNDLIMSTAFGSPPLDMETRVVLCGAKLQHDVYIDFDTPEACRQMLEGLRIIRCEKSMLFSENLEKWKSKGFD